jgi:hypothetical protein
VNDPDPTKPAARTEDKPLESELLELRREIERTRSELGATVEALSQKADVKAQAREKVEHAKVQARERAQETQAKAKQQPALPIGIGVGALLFLVWRIRRR